MFVEMDLPAGRQAAVYKRCVDEDMSEASKVENASLCACSIFSSNLLPHFCIGLEVV